jgi:hypothetical protein
VTDKLLEVLFCTCMLGMWLKVLILFQTPLTSILFREGQVPPQWARDWWKSL